MEVPWQTWFSQTEEMEGEDFFNQGLDDEPMVLEEILLHQSAFSSESDSHSPSAENNSVSAAAGGGGGDAPTVVSLSFGDKDCFLKGKRGNNILTKSNSCNSIVSQHAPEKPASGGSYILSFNDSTQVAVAGETHSGKQAKHGQVGSSKGVPENQKCCSGTRANQTAKKLRSSSESQGHIMAERKRRQELTERFIALSATIPGLKKIDKASILSEAITYVKQLQERVRELEEQRKKERIESVSFVGKSSLSTDEGSASCEMNSEDCYKPKLAFPEVEAKVMQKEVLIRIHCKKQKGTVVKILAHLKSLDLSAVSNSVLPFGDSALDITIIAQMGDKYDVTVKDLVKNLRLALLGVT